jgi:hypothetical protein
VAIVQNKGRISLLFTTAKISGPKRVKLANGKVIPYGYVIRARPRSLRSPHQGDQKRLNFKWYAHGQFRYFRAKTAKPVYVGGKFAESAGPYLTDGVLGQSASFRPFTGGIPGVPRDHPEARLVSQYVKWIRNEERFGHNYIKSAGLFVDLFDRRYWHLIEAKYYIDRNTIRTAIGQLLDYKRYYLRRPSLGVLLTQRPQEAALKLLSDYKIAAIWRTEKGRFRDSTENNKWTRRE